MGEFGLDGEAPRLHNLLLTLAPICRCAMRSRSREELRRDLIRLLVDVGKFHVVDIVWEPSPANAVSGASATIPIRVHGEPYGTLMLAWAGGSPFSEREMELLSDAASDIGFALERLSTEEKLRQTEASRTTNDRRLALSMDAAGISTFDSDLTTGNVLWAGHHERLFGLNPGEFHETYSQFENRVHPDDRLVLSQAIDRARITHTALSGEFRVLLPDGGVRWVSGLGQFYYDQAGRPNRMCGAMFDISERKSSELALRRSEERLGLAIRVSNIQIFDHDHSSGTIYRSPEMRENQGSESEKRFTFDHLFDLIHPEDVGRFKECVRRAHDPAGDGLFDVEYRIIRGDGTVRWLSSRSRTFFEGGGPAARAVRTVGAISDITDRKQVEDQQTAARLAAESADRSKSEFLAKMSHELRTPMNGVIGIVDLLLDTQLTAEQREYLDVVRMSGDALLTVISDILDISRLEAGSLPLESEPFDICEVVEQVIKLLAPAIRTKGLNLVAQIDGQIPPMVYGDCGRVRQVVLNLVGNAIKFTASGGVCVAIERRNENELTVSVIDSGIGISPETAGRLFQKFVQADASTTRRYGGSGLGLAISKQLVELMGGSIHVESTPGEGSTFWFTFPISEPVEQADRARTASR